MFPKAKPRGTLRAEGNKTHFFPYGQSLSVFLYLPTQNYGKHFLLLFADARQPILVLDLNTCASSAQLLFHMGVSEF